jgi:REP element-mobilizing transposase RayT
MSRPPLAVDALRLSPQLALDLRERTHGGARPGAGRPRVKDKDRGFIAHGVRPSHRKGDPVHVTLRVKKGIPSLRRQSLERVVKLALLKQRNALDEAGAKHFQVVHFTIQSDHLHLIVEAPDKRGLARGVAGLEIRIARRLNRLLGRKGRFWKERYHRHDLRTPTETRNALRYVLLNAQKHYRVIGDRAFADPFSSAATFDGFTRPPATFDDATSWAWVQPRTWLLGVGWRTRGLIDPADAPAARDRGSTSERAWLTASRRGRARP